MASEAKTEAADEIGDYYVTKSQGTFVSQTRGEIFKRPAAQSNSWPSCVMVGVGHKYLASGWRQNQPPGGIPRGQRVLYLSCLWSNLADTLVDGRGVSHGYHARWRSDHPPGGTPGGQRVLFQEH